jgi:hypothetical protein
MLFFRDEEHIEAWCKTWSLPKGAVLDLATAWGLSQVWFGVPRNHPDWRRFTPDETREIFARLGLIGEFWEL